VAVERHIVGLGGGGDTAEQTRLLYDYVLALTGKPKPRLLYVPTAAAESAEAIVGFYERLRGRADLNHLCTFPWPPEDLRDLILSQDAICVSGGNTANMLAIWKTHGIDVLLREAWENGIVLWGASAGMICWYEAGVTDSFGPQLAGVDCLGLLAGRACPHYDGSELREIVTCRRGAAAYRITRDGEEELSARELG
jgi:dipeptidase E